MARISAGNGTEAFAYRGSEESGPIRARYCADGVPLAWSPQVIEGFLDFVHENGSPSMVRGVNQKYIEVGATTFIRKSDDTNEVNIGRWLPEHPSGKLPVFSPVYERRMGSFDVFIVATRDIKAGEEIVKPKV